jgi:L-histidine N-alpha-methyltransferase
MHNMAAARHSSYFPLIVALLMPIHHAPSLFASDKRHLWRCIEPSIWSLAADAPQEDPAHAVLRTLWDQPRWLEAYHLYDDRGAKLFEAICELPEYYLTRTENAILEQQAERILTLAPVQCIVELGAGSAKKTIHLLNAQVNLRGGGIFSPIDVSLPGLQASRDFVGHHLPQLDFHGLHARYEDGFSVIDKALPTLFVFLGSTIGNFNPPEFVRFFIQLTHAMGSDDYLLLGADRLKDVAILERAYADARGLTAEFILNVCHNINHLTGSNFDLGKMRYHSWFNPEWAQIEMYAVATAAQEIRFPAFGASFLWKQDHRILVEISRKFEPLRLQEQLSFFDLSPVEHFTDANNWFSLLLLKKKT